MKDVCVIIAAAGEGRRLGKTAVPKPFIRFLVKGRSTPLLLITLQRFLRLPEVDEVVIAVHPGQIQRAKTLLKGLNQERLKLVAGGKRRQDSIANALKAINPQNRVVLVHDAARPMVSPELIRQVVKAARRYGVALPVLPVTDTIKRVTPQKGYIKETVKPRSELYVSQTPQGFRREIILKAYQAAYRRGITASDDAALAEALGYPVKTVTGDPRNLKLTTPLDKIFIDSLLSL